MVSCDLLVVIEFVQCVKRTGLEPILRVFLNMKSKKDRDDSYLSDFVPYNVRNPVVFVTHWCVGNACHTRTGDGAYMQL
jgi:hypothetical protein